MVAYHGVRPLSSTAALALVAGVIGLSLYASATPSPLYAIYQLHWGTSVAALTAVFAMYALGVLAALLLGGGMSDEVGRRPVLVAALIGLLIAAVLFMMARSMAWLLVARGLQGLATGAALAAGGAALLDLAPGGDARRAGLINGVSVEVGITFGVLVTSVLAQFVSGPLLTPYLVLAALIVAALVAMLALPESAPRSGRFRLRPQYPRVPRAIRGSFFIAAFGVLAAWSVAGVYLALGPALAMSMVDSTNHLAGGASVLALSGPAALAQVGFEGVDARRATWIGALVLACGMALAAGSLSSGSVLLFLLATGVVGVGFGLAFVGPLRLLTPMVPEHQRGGLMAAFYLIAYSAFSLPAVAAGLTVTELGIQPTFRCFSALVVVVSLVAAVATRSHYAFDRSPFVAN